MAIVKPASNKLITARKAYEAAKAERLRLRDELNRLYQEARDCKAIIANEKTDYADFLQAQRRYKAIEASYPALELQHNAAALHERKLEIAWRELQRDRAEAVRVLNTIAIPEGTWRESYTAEEIETYRRKAEQTLAELREE